MGRQRHTVFSRRLDAQEAKKSDAARCEVLRTGNASTKQMDKPLSAGQWHSRTTVEVRLERARADTLDESSTAHGEEEGEEEEEE